MSKQTHESCRYVGVQCLPAPGGPSGVSDPAMKVLTAGLSRLLILGAILSISGCGFFGGKKPDANALCISECPDLTALPDDSFGATSKKLKEIADQYYLCRAACQVKK